MPELVSRLSLFSEEACEDWVLRVMWLKRLWRKRHPQVPFYTLGMAAYLDHAPQEGCIPYRDQAALAHNNQMLGTHFAPLLELLCLILGREAGCPARLAQQAAWPGFHVYLPHPAFADPVAKIHHDLQYRDVFPGARPAADELLSFTLPLSTPEGSGLHCWPEGDAQRAPQFFPYRSGELVWHSGLVLHQAVLNCAQGLERVTLQGHALRRDGELLLYW